MNDGFLHGTLVPVLYLVSAVIFIVGIKGMTKIRSARRGNLYSSVGMLLAIVATLVELGHIDYRWIVVGIVVGSLIGAFAAMRVAMTAMPEMVALFNGAGGGASMLVGISILWVEVIEVGTPQTAAAVMHADSAVSTALSILIGGVTLAGSVVAYLQLQEKLLPGKPVLLPGRHAINLILFFGALATGLWAVFGTTDLGLMGAAAIVCAVLSLLLGIGLVIPIGGADMPVVISLLNSYSGMAACATGFVLRNNLLIITGALVGSSGIILTKIMCDAMNRTLTNVLFGGFGMVDTTAAAAGGEYQGVRSCGSEEAAMLLESAETVVFVPGYGLAVAQAQHIVRELASELEKRGTKVAYGIHPVAGRMPGHMNVLLAEADVPYDQLKEMDVINPDFKETDVVLVVGANDVVNPAAERNPGSPIYGMPVMRVWDAKTVFVIKRSLAAGFAGIKNELFENQNTVMIFGDAKKVLQGLVSEVKQAAAA